MRTKQPIRKSMEKTKRYNTEILNRLKKKYGVSKRFITMSLNGDRKSETSISIVSDYGQLEKKVEDALK